MPCILVCNWLRVQQGGFGGGGGGNGGGNGDGLGTDTLVDPPPAKHILILHLLFEYILSPNVDQHDT